MSGRGEAHEWEAAIGGGADKALTLTLTLTHFIHFSHRRWS